jgi:hypothetical protein
MTSRRASLKNLDSLSQTPLLQGMMRASSGGSRALNVVSLEAPRLAFLQCWDGFKASKAPH